MDSENGNARIFDAESDAVLTSPGELIQQRGLISRPPPASHIGDSRRDWLKQ
jgi:hypothetical protein